MVWPWRWGNWKKKKKKFEITNLHWREIWRAFGLKRFRSKYYYLTKWTEKSTVYGKWELVVWPWRWGNWKKKKKKFEITNLHWREIWRAFGLKRFRCKYYYLTKWTEKSTVYGKWELVVWPWRWGNWKKKKKKFEITNSHWREIWRAFGLKRFRCKYYYLTKWTEKSTVSGNWQLVVWPWRWENWKKKIKIWNHEFALAWNLESFWFKMISL